MKPLSVTSNPNQIPTTLPKARRFLERYAQFIEERDNAGTDYSRYNNAHNSLREYLDSALLKINLDAWEPRLANVFARTTGLQWTCSVADGSAEYVWVEGHVLHLETYDGYRAPAPAERGLILQDFIDHSRWQRRLIIASLKKKGEEAPAFPLPITVPVNDLIELK